MGTTSLGFRTPEDVDPVRQGALAMRNLAGDIDTYLKTRNANVRRWTALRGADGTAQINTWQTNVQVVAPAAEVKAGLYLMTCILFHNNQTASGAITRARLNCLQLSQISAQAYLTVPVNGYANFSLSWLFEVSAAQAGQSLTFAAEQYADQAVLYRTGSQITVARVTDY